MFPDTTHLIYEEKVKLCMFFDGGKRGRALKSLIITLKLCNSSSNPLNWNQPIIMSVAYTHSQHTEPLTPIMRP